MRVKIPQLRDEPEEVRRDVQIALNFPSNSNLGFKIADLVQVNDQTPLKHMPYYPKFWAMCAETVCKLSGMSDQLAAMFRMRVVETACQMVGMDTADASVPRVAHPMLGAAPPPGQADTRLLWVTLMDDWEDFGPEPWM